MGTHPGEFFTHHGRYFGYFWDHPVQIQIPHDGRYHPGCCCPRPGAASSPPGGGSAPGPLPYPKPQSLRIRQDSASGAEEGWSGEGRLGMACPDWLSSRQYAVWLVLWVGWNAFIICFYLEVGRLSQVTTPPSAPLAASSSSLPPSSIFPSFLLSCRLHPPSPALQLCPPKRDPEPVGAPTLVAKHPPGCWGCLHRGSRLQHRAPRHTWDGQTDSGGDGGRLRRRAKLMRPMSGELHGAH